MGVDQWQAVGRLGRSGDRRHGSRRHAAGPRHFQCSTSVLEGGAAVHVVIRYAAVGGRGPTWQLQGGQEDVGLLQRCWAVDVGVPRRAGGHLRAVGHQLLRQPGVCRGLLGGMEGLHRQLLVLVLVLLALLLLVLLVLQLQLLLMLLLVLLWAGAAVLNVRAGLLQGGPAGAGAARAAGRGGLPE
jgi:hypothetical protein